MGLLAWFTRNWADTDEPEETELKPIELLLAPAATQARVEAAIRHLRGWQMGGFDPASRTIQATRTTRVFRFVDDVTIRLEPIGQGTRVHARSQSRIGKGDFGQNGRNLRELFRALQAEAGG